MMAHAWNLNTGEGEGAGLEVLGGPQLCEEFRANLGYNDSLAQGEKEGNNMA